MSYDMSSKQQNNDTKQECVDVDNMKPVAWMMIRNGEFFDAIHPDEHARHEGAYTIPLYTAPQTNIKFNQTLECPSYLSGLAPRELSDEEIEALWEKHCPFDLTAGIDFARAILKKASEK